MTNAVGNHRCQYAHSELIWTGGNTTYDAMPICGQTPTAAIQVGTAGIVVYEGIDGVNRQVASEECVDGALIHIQAKRLLSSGTVGGSTVTSTARFVRLYW